MSAAAKPPAGSAASGDSANHSALRAPRSEFRAVLHLNVANFAVAVERGVDCRLRDWPVIVAPEGAARAVVYDMSEEAYQAGIRKGMALRQAQRRCRDARLLAPHFDRYERAMRALQARALPLTPQVEVVDEAGHLFLDLSGTSRLHGPPRDVAWRLRRQIQADLGLDPIWSLAPNKLVAKVATRLVKPDGEYLVEPGEERRFLAPLPVHLLPGLERDQLALLRELNLRCAADVARLPLGRLEEAFGPGAGLLHDTVRGVDPTPVLPAGRRMGRLWLDHEFGDDQHRPDVVEAALFSLVERAGRRLRRRRLGARRVGLQLDYSDGLRALGSASRREATANDFALHGLARTALGRAWTRRVRLRHLRLICDRLAAPSTQLSLLPQEQGRAHSQEQLVGALDRIRQRFGIESIRVGRTLTSSPPHPLTPSPPNPPYPPPAA